ncbi:MAG: hypothetical protein JXQ71_11630 [Verrucomicrobia bacterium]|nr:hypothetical protein [Verrucomicrobiota bacterium]
MDRVRAVPRAFVVGARRAGCGVGHCFWGLCLVGLLVLGVRGVAAENAVRNGGFESGLEGWQVWSREPGAMGSVLDVGQVHGGRRSLRLEHRGGEDWSLEPGVRLGVRVGEVIELRCWVKVQGGGSVTLCASTWDARGKVVSWAHGGRSASGGSGWQDLRTRIVVAAKVVEVRPRLIGHGPATIWVDDYASVRAGKVEAMRGAGLPAVLVLRNAALDVAFDTTRATLAVTRLPAGRRWTQQPVAGDWVVRRAEVRDGRVRGALMEVGTGLDVDVTLRLDGDLPELVVELSARGSMPGSLRFPHPFTGEAGDDLVVPLNEGISYPVDDPTISPLHLVAYGGHGICMAFFGMTDGTNGQMAILETPDDAAIRVERHAGRLAILPEWQPQRGEWGETRRLRYVFLDGGGHVAMAKRYRAYAQQAGRFKTLEEKRRLNPALDLLVGAVNVWCWERDAVSRVREMQEAGIGRILWSNRQTPENLEALNQRGVLTSRYDIYQDVMAPTNFPRLRWIHPDWTTNAWPHDVILDARGQWIKGWRVEARDGGMIPCGVICDRRALEYARQRIPPELTTHPYRCRFIDTTTAAPWHECYHPDHPMTRTESRQYKMALLRYVSEDLRLVTGSETGHDAAVPYVHYFEGMLSLGPYRVPDAGRRMSQIWTNVPEPVAKFQLGHRYRLPLWELVYHDCVVAQWYWGDYNNKLPALWDKRDRFNVLYGVPPMFMFDAPLWQRQKARFVQSYHDTCPHVRRVGYQEMTDHRFLTPDRDVQQTVFANGVRITVNFGSRPFRMPDGVVLQPMDYRVQP